MHDSCCVYLCSHASCLRSRYLRVYSVLSRVLLGIGIARQRNFDGHRARWCSGRFIVLPLATGGRANLSICSAGGLHRRDLAKGRPSTAVLVNKVMAEDYVNVTSFSALANKLVIIGCYSLSVSAQRIRCLLHVATGSSRSVDARLAMQQSLMVYSVLFENRVMLRGRHQGL